MRADFHVYADTYFKESISTLCSPTAEATRIAFLSIHNGEYITPVCREEEEEGGGGGRNESLRAINKPSVVRGDIEQPTESRDYPEVEQFSTIFTDFLVRVERKIYSEFTFLELKLKLLITRREKANMKISEKYV